MGAGREERSRGPPQGPPGLYKIFRMGALIYVESRRKETHGERMKLLDKRSKSRWSD